MSAITCPSDEELYLLAILWDESGIDIAEFAFPDPSQDHGRTRLRDYQWPYMNDDSQQQNDLSSRDVGKSWSISVRAAAFPFSYPGEHMLIFAPELNHLDPLTQAIEQRLDSCRLLREMRPANHAKGIKRSPHWQCTFLNQAIIFSRLPGQANAGPKGMHVIKLEVDEGQDLDDAVWVELEPTIERGKKGWSWRVHGVTRGVGDTFDRLAESPEWTTHKLMAMHRPTWNDSERASKIAMYGGSSLSADYRRNIFGEPGDTNSALFVLARLKKCQDGDPNSLYNRDIYTAIKLEEEMLNGRTPAEIVESRLNGIHKSTWELAPKGYSAFYGGMDIGATIDPTEILIFGQRADKQREQLDLLLRIRLLRIPIEDQQEVVELLLRYYGPKLVSFGLDRSGLGFDIYQRLHRKYNDRIQGFNFAAKYAVELEDRDMKLKEELSDLAIDRPFIEFASDALREVVDAKGFLLPDDSEVLSEWRGESYFVIKAKGGPYGAKKQYSSSSCHSLDAARVMIAGKRLQGLHKLLADNKPQEAVIDVFIGGY